MSVTERDTMAGKYHRDRECRKAFALALDIVPKPHCLYWSRYNFEAFRYYDTSVLLIFYRHRTSARNYHVRVRDGGSKDRERADQLMAELDKAAGFNCTFTRKARNRRG